jgi:hypothetical protein
LNRLDRTQWRGMIGYVPQELILFHDTVYANVALGDPAVTEADARDALEAAGAWDFVSDMPDGTTPDSCRRIIGAWPRPRRWMPTLAAPRKALQPALQAVQATAEHELRLTCGSALPHRHENPGGYNTTPFYLHKD